MIEHETRISVLESKLDALAEIVERVDSKLDDISKKQLEIEIHTRIAYNVGKWFIGAGGIFLSWIHWDTVITFVHNLTKPQP